MQDAKKFREFAAECQRLAQHAAAKDKAVLLEIANAWIECAERVERDQRGSGNPRSESDEKHE
jgi:hypothetical protein